MSPKTFFDLDFNLENYVEDDAEDESSEIDEPTTKKMRKKRDVVVQENISAKDPDNVPAGETSGSVISDGPANGSDNPKNVKKKKT